MKGLSRFVKKASQKLNALLRMASSLKFKPRKLLLNAFSTAQFSYVPAIRTFILES